jgi:hypothetical protein
MAGHLGSRLCLCIIVVTLALSLAEDAEWKDSDGDGIPDKYQGKGDGVCYDAGKGLLGFLSSPIYYLGMIVYTLLYPIIFVVETIRSIASIIIYVIMFIPLLVLQLIYWILYIIWVVVSFLPGLMIRITLWFVAILGKTLAVVALGILLCAFIIQLVQRAGLMAGGSIGAVIAIVAVIVLQMGAGTLFWLVMCPFQALYGGLVGWAGGLVYWQAVLTLSYAPA